MTLISEILLVLKFIFSNSRGKLFSVLFEATVCIFRKCKKDCTILQVIMAYGFCRLKIENSSS